MDNIHALMRSDVYEISCGSCPSVNGRYVENSPLIGERRYYSTSDSKQYFTRQSSGTWEVISGDKRVCFSGDASRDPTTIRTWYYVKKGLFGSEKNKDCTDMSITYRSGEFMAW
jgi:hypothetical protein